MSAVARLSRARFGAHKRRLPGARRNCRCGGSIPTVCRIRNGPFNPHVLASDFARCGALLPANTITELDASVELRLYRRTWSGKRAEIEHIALTNLEP